MPIFKKKDLNELVGGDINSGGGDRNVVNNSEIETGPVQKPYTDTSDYEKGASTTTDKVTGRYRQNLPWFANYNFSGTMRESKVLKKKIIEENIENIIINNKLSNAK